MKSFRDRLLIPVSVPLTAVIVVMVIVFSISRVLLAMEEKSSPTMATLVAIVVSSAVLFAGSWFSVRRQAGGLAALGAAGLLVVVAGSASFAALRGGDEHEVAQGTDGGLTAAHPLALTAFDLGFRETELTAAAGEIEIEYRNEGDLDHTLVFEGVGAATPLKALPQSTEKGTVKLEPGTYVYYCDLPGHRAAGMEGKLTVTQGGAAAAAGGGVADIVAQDLAFEPSEVTVPAGVVKINLKNEGELLHNVLFDGVAGFAKVEASGGSTASGTADLKPGKYVFFCDQPGHRAAGMEGTLVVADGGSEGGLAAAGGSGSSAEVVAQDIAFEPAEISVPAGPVKLTLRNEGELVHTLVVDGAAFKKLETATHGATATGTLEAGPGRYAFYCDQPGHRAAGMEGTIVVGSP